MQYHETPPVLVDLQMEIAFWRRDEYRKWSVLPTFIDNRVERDEVMTSIRAVNSTDLKLGSSGRTHQD